MPLLDFNDQAVWDSLYGPHEVDGYVLHYARRAKDRILGNDAKNLAKALNLHPGQRIALIGSGFGFVGEEFLELGLGLVACCDTSQWIHDHKSQHAYLEILNADVMTDVGREIVTEYLGGAVDIAISEDILPILSDSEAEDLATAMRVLAADVVHWVSVGTPSSIAGLNWKTFEEWKTFVTPDRVVQRGTATVL